MLGPLRNCFLGTVGSLERWAPRNYLLGTVEPWELFPRNGGLLGIISGKALSLGSNFR
jgi:hypothetical protein